MSQMIISPRALRAVELEFLDHHDEIKAQAKKVDGPEEFYPYQSLIDRAVEEMLSQSRQAARQCDRFAGAIRDYVIDATNVDTTVSDSARKGQAR
jgi:hypothetical protein